MARKIAPLLLAAALIIGVAQAWAEAPNLCCQSFDGTTATGCTFLNDSDNSGCSGVLLDLDCGASTSPSSSLECATQNNAKLAAAGTQLRGGNNGLSCRCVSTSVGSTF